MVEQACRLASVAAGIAVGRAGTYVVQAAELAAAWRGGSPKILDRAAARAGSPRPAGRPARGLHQRLLRHPPCRPPLLPRTARALGDLLVVALNSDASVRVNKGPHGRSSDRTTARPCWRAWPASTSWSSSTSRRPESLIRYLGPDVLVKGSDYAVAARSPGQISSRAKAGG